MTSLSDSWISSKKSSLSCPPSVLLSKNDMILLSNFLISPFNSPTRQHPRPHPHSRVLLNSRLRTPENSPLICLHLLLHTLSQTLSKSSNTSLPLFSVETGGHQTSRIGKLCPRRMKNQPLDMLASRTLDAVIKFYLILLWSINFIWTGNTFFFLIILACYMNSLLQQLFMIPSFREDILKCKDPSFETSAQEDNVLNQLKVSIKLAWSSYKSKKKSFLSACSLRSSLVRRRRSIRRCYVMLSKTSKATQQMCSNKWISTSSSTPWWTSWKIKWRGPLIPMQLRNISEEFSPTKSSRRGVLTPPKGRKPFSPSLFRWSIKKTSSRV